MTECVGCGECCKTCTCYWAWFYLKLPHKGPCVKLVKVDGIYRCQCLLDGDERAAAVIEPDRGCSNALRVKEGA